MLIAYDYAAVLAEWRLNCMFRFVFHFSIIMIYVCHKYSNFIIFIYIFLHFFTNLFVLVILLNSISCLGPLLKYVNASKYIEIYWKVLGIKMSYIFHFLLQRQLEIFFTCYKRPSLNEGFGHFLCTNFTILFFISKLYYLYAIIVRNMTHLYIYAYICIQIT